MGLAANLVPNGLDLIVKSLPEGGILCRCSLTRQAEKVDNEAVLYSFDEIATILIWLYDRRQIALSNAKRRQFLAVQHKTHADGYHPMNERCEFEIIAAARLKSAPMRSFSQYCLICYERQAPWQGFL